jgi:K(+)-stimulated pyrophosphate-energized sodium pump
MNLVSLLIAPAVVSMFLDNNALRWAIAAGAVAIVVGAVIITKRRPIAVSPEEIGVSTS